MRIVALVRCCPKDYRSVEKEKVYEKETLRNQSVPPLDSLKWYWILEKFEQSEKVWMEVFMRLSWTLRETAWQEGVFQVE